MARALGPGPGAYRLPATVGYSGHDPSRYRNPMYSFGVSNKGNFGSLGPGPAYRIDRVTREGTMSAPAWSFGARFATRASSKAPGPGAHAPERCPPMKEPRAPQYSMGARLGYKPRAVGPAPNAYALKLKPGSPSYSMAARLGFINKPLSPGPAAYFQKNQDLYKTRYPIYSLGARLDPRAKGKSPGPAAYPPGLYNTKKNPYSYSFGIKHAPWAPPLIIREDTMDCL